MCIILVSHVIDLNNQFTAESIKKLTSYTTRDSSAVVIIATAEVGKGSCHPAEFMHKLTDRGHIGLLWLLQSTLVLLLAVFWTAHSL